MILDSRFYFGEVDLEGGPADGDPLLLCPNVVDLGADDRDVITGGKIPYVMFHVTEQGAPNITDPGPPIEYGTPRLLPFAVYSDNPALVTGGANWVLIPSASASYVLTATTVNVGGILASGLTANRRFYVPLPPPAQSQMGLVTPLHRLRYLGAGFLQTTWSGNFLTAGKIEAELVYDPPAPDLLLYPDATN